MLIVAPLRLTPMLPDFAGSNGQGQPNPSDLLACPPAVVLATCHRDIQGCLPSSRHIDTPFHFFDTITAPGRANLRSSHQRVQRSLLFLLSFCGSNATDSARVRASICTVRAACLRRLQLLDDKHPCPCVYFLSSPAASHSHILQPISHTIRIIRTTTTTKFWENPSCYNCHFKRTITPIILHCIVL